MTGKNGNGSGEYKSCTTIPAPGSEQLGVLLAEVQLACVNLGDLIEKLGRRLNATQLALLTGEHRINVQASKTVSNRKWLADHERRLRSLEGLGKTDAE